MIVLPGRRLSDFEENFGVPRKREADFMIRFLNLGLAGTFLDAEDLYFN